MYFFVDKRVSHKNWRAFVKAERRRKRRRLLASEKSLEEERQLDDLLSDPAYRARIEEQNRLEEEACRLEEITARRRREEWIAKDFALHSLWLKNKDKDRRLLEDQQRKEDLLKQEWEAGVRKEEEQKTKKQEQQEALLRDATSQLGGEFTSNPDPPAGYSRACREREVEACPFFNKTGACRFGPDCSREHKYPRASRTILLANMYSHIGLQGDLTDDYDMDLALEYSESDRHKHFRDFYFDVLPEFEKCGHVIQFKVCCNKSPHLRGNVYVQFDEVKAAEDAVRRFNGRWYAGKQISCIFIPIERWKTAICGLYWNRKCPKGDLCNFLHVFKNPDNAFHGADRDYHLTRKNTRDESGGNSSRRSRKEEEESRRHRSRNRRKSSDSHRSYVSERSSRSERDRERSTSSRRSHNQSSERERSRSSRKRSRDRCDKRSRESYRNNTSEMNKENKKERSGKSKRES